MYFLGMSEWTSSSPARSVLSVQSHVVCGYVGNRAAVPALQMRGLHADALNTVVFSNHTGYRTIKGSIMEIAEFRELLAGLEANGLLSLYSSLLTGYNARTEIVEEVGLLVDKLRAENPSFKYVCDPVLGDAGEFYVPAELAAAVRSALVPRADLVTPNQFEAELISGEPTMTECSNNSLFSIIDENYVYIYFISRFLYIHK